MQTQQNNYLPTFITYVKPIPLATSASFLRNIAWTALGALTLLTLAALTSILMGQFNDYLAQIIFNKATLLTMLLQTIFAQLLPSYILMGIERKREQKRQLAAHGAEHLLSDWQPLPATPAISLPSIIQYRVSKKQKVTQWLTILILFFVLPLILLLIPPLHALHSYYMVTIISIFVPIGIFCAAKAAQPKNIRLLADQTGLSLYNGETRLQHIPWYEARLFSIVETAKQTHNGMPHIFELASAQEIIRWPAQNENAWHEENGTSTLLSPGAYLFHIQILHSLITKNTSLPLYDLRK